MQLKTLPAGIGALDRLLSLNLFSNKLKTLPEELGGLTSLKKLILHKNAVCPSFLSTLSTLCALFSVSPPLDEAHASAAPIV